MSEDERYRKSTQYRLWSYTPASLLALRTQTNHLAAECVRAAVKRDREARALSSADTSEAENGISASAVAEGEIECLTPEEELKLLVYYCGRTIAGADHLNLPTDVKATAVQYLKRFYITNSIMTYAPADILKTALFFATKTENHYYRLSKFAVDISNGTKPEDVLASEFLLTQGLRFTFDVRHPFRALEGASMEINAMAEGDVPSLLGGGEVKGERPNSLVKRNRTAHGKARDILKTSAVLTDVYFHFTPSQIMMAAISIADEELFNWYIGTKFPAGDRAAVELKVKVIATVRKCADMLKTVAPAPEIVLSAAEKKEMAALSKKLKKCRNPEKIDLVGLQRAKREGDDREDEKVVKKRKLEREKSEKEGDDLFGPSLKKS